MTDLQWMMLPVLYVLGWIAGVSIMVIIERRWR